MADRLHLRVYTPERTLADATVRDATLPASDGEIGVLPDHTALVTALGTGVLSYRHDGGTTRLLVEGGFAEVVENVLTVLADGGRVDAG